MTSYKEFEKKINEFMEKTGIREFCREYCKGGCCSSVVFHGRCSKSCMNGKIPINCAMYICTHLANLLNIKTYADLAKKIIFKQPEETLWKPKKIKIGKDEEALLKIIDSLDWQAIMYKVWDLEAIANYIKRNNH